MPKFEYVGEDYPQLKGRVFSGPDTSMGVLGPWRIGELRWVKAQLKVDAIEELDALEAQAVYFLLSVRAEDGEALPFGQFRALFDNIRGTDFRQVDEVPQEAETPDPTGPLALASSETTSS